jgi:hypothetical protein
MQDHPLPARHPLTLRDGDAARGRLEAALAVRLLRFTGNGSLTLLAARVVVWALIEAAEPKPRGLLSRLLPARAGPNR